MEKITNNEVPHGFPKIRKNTQFQAKDWEDNPATSILGQIAGFVPFAIGQAGSRAIAAAGKSPAPSTTRVRRAPEWSRWNG